MSTSATTTASLRQHAETTMIDVLLALSVAHLLNDVFQVMLPAIYPVLKTTHGLNYTQLSNITLVYQVTGSLLQPAIGYFTDRRPLPYSLPLGMGISLVSMILLSRATTYPLLLVSACMMGFASSVFHPEASRVARLASGGRHGFAQSLFQVGGNLGTSFGPLLAAAVVTARGQSHILWFTLPALVGITLLAWISRWYRGHLDLLLNRPRNTGATVRRLPHNQVVGAIAVLVALVFSKYIYLISLTNYYTFYLIEKFGVSVQGAQFYLFVFLFAIAAGTYAGGPVGDRIGRKKVIWISILGVAPFSLLLPHVGLVATVGLSIVIGLILASAFSAILVYAQELVPGNVGLIAGLFFGLAFGFAGIGSALLGRLADHTSINTVFQVAAYLPLLGILTAFLPEIEGKKR
ncbi:MAG TPA: MFS transporter [Candidatus Didemnitutus sp.]|nr:MFS transporter [Candidatus Didemnitutus sp.]